MEELTIESYQAFNLRIRSLLHMGCLFRHPKLSPLAYGAIVIVTLFINIYMFYAGTMYCLQYLRNFEQLCRGIAFFGSTATAFVKVACFWANYNDLKELDETVKFMFDTELKDESRRTHLLHSLPSFRRIATAYNFIIFCTCLLHHLVVMWVIPYQLIYHIRPMKCPLPAPGIFPFVINGCGSLYMLHYLFVVINSAFIYFLNMIAEVSFLYYATHIAGIFRTMRERLENPEPNENRTLLLRSCAKKHKMMLHCRDMMEDIYGPLIVFVVLVNSLMLCCIIYQVFQKKLTVLMGVMLGAYLFAKLMQIGVYTWCATVVATESEKFSEGIYFSDWIGKSVTMKSDIVITIMQKPLMINCLGLFIVSMDLFPKVVNTALSYYFLLRTLEED